jgi:hypothetical protein
LRPERGLWDRQGLWANLKWTSQPSSSSLLWWWGQFFSFIVAGFGADNFRTRQRPKKTEWQTASSGSDAVVAPIALELIG